MEMMNNMDLITTRSAPAFSAIIASISCLTESFHYRLDQTESQSQHHGHCQTQQPLLILPVSSNKGDLKRWEYWVGRAGSPSQFLL